MLRLRRNNLQTLMDLSPELREDADRAHKERFVAIQSLGQKREDAEGEVSPA